MEWIGTLLIGVLVMAGLVQLFWTYAISAIARKTDQSELLEVLAWIPLLQIAPMIRAGGGSIGGFLLGLVGLVLSLISLFGVAALLGDGLGPAIPVLGSVLAGLLCLVYAGQLCWQTATARGLSGWIGLLVFVPIANLFAYPYIAFHDGLIRPNRLGAAIGTLLMLLCAAPSIDAIRTVTQEIEAESIPSPARILALFSPEDGSREVDSTGANALGPDDPDASGVRADESLRALYALKPQFDSLDDVAQGDDPSNALALVQALRGQLESSRKTLDASTFGELATHLLEVEKQLRTRSTPAAPRPRRRTPEIPQAPASAAPLAWRTPQPKPVRDETSLAPVHPLPVEIREACPDETVLRTAREEEAEEEWCQQVDHAGGLRHGFYARYRLDGRPESIGEYRNGLRVGVWTRFHPSGRVRAQAEFRKGLQHGWVLTFDESGNLTRSVRFEAGIAVPSERPAG